MLLEKKLVCGRVSECPDVARNLSGEGAQDDLAHVSSPETVSDDRGHGHALAGLYVGQEGGAACAVWDGPETGE